MVGVYSYDNLSTHQRRVVDILRKRMELRKIYETKFKRGIIVVGLLGSGKTHVLRTLKNMGLVAAVLSGREIYEDVSEDIELKREETIKKILEGIRSAAEESKYSFIALDNPDIPLDSNVTKEAALRFTWRLLEEAAHGRLPFMVVALDEFTYKRFEYEREDSMTEIMRYFDIVKLVWNSEDIEKAVRAWMGPLTNTSRGKELLKDVTVFTRTPASAIALFDKALTEDRPVLEILTEGLRYALDEYIKLLSQRGYKLSKAKSKKWTEVWRMIISDERYRDLIAGLIRREGVKARELSEALGTESDWPKIAAVKYRIIERPEPLVYRFTDEFLAAAAGYAAETPSVPSAILKSMAKLYGEIGIEKT